MCEHLSNKENIILEFSEMFCWIHKIFWKFTSNALIHRSLFVCVPYIEVWLFYRLSLNDIIVKMPASLGLTLGCFANLDLNNVLAPLLRSELHSGITCQWISSKQRTGEIIWFRSQYCFKDFIVLFCIITGKKKVKVLENFHEILVFLLHWGLMDWPDYHSIKPSTRIKINLN